MELQEVEKREDRSMMFKMTLDKSEIEDIRFGIYKVIRPTLNIHGFRRGKVPIKTAEGILGINNLYGSKIFDMLIEGISDKGYEIYATKDFKIDNDFVTECTVFPYQIVNFNKDVNDLSIIKEIAEVTNEEIESSKRNVIYEYSDRVEVPEDYQAQNGDELTVIMTVENLNTEKIIAKEVETEIVLGLNDDGVGKNLEGVRKNEKGVFSIVVNKEEYQYEILCKEIWKLKSPTEEEMLKTLKINTVHELECKIREKIQEKKQARIEKESFNKIFNILEENSNFVLDQKTINSLISHVDDNQKETFKNIVTRNYRQSSLLISAAKSLNLKISDTEIDNEVKKMELKENKKRKINKKVKLEIKQRLLEQKAMDILIKNKELQEE